MYSLEGKISNLSDELYSYVDINICCLAAIEALLVFLWK